jgi:MFS family permease
MKSGRARPPAIADPDERTPVGINLGIGTAMVVAGGIVAALIPPSLTGWRFAVMALTVSCFAACTLDRVALLGVVVLAWLVTNGFLVDRFGQLSWHGSPDLYRMMVLVIVGALGLAVGELYRQARSIRARRPGFDEEARRDA